MVDIVVIRGNGDKPGDDIVEPLLATVPAAIERGRNELDGASLSDSVQLTVRFRSDVRLGGLIEVHDALQGRSWRGKLVGIAHRAGDGAVVTLLDVWRPRS